MENNQRKLLFNYFLYFFTFILLCFYGISHASAVTWVNIGDQSNITVVLVSTDYGDAPYTVPKGSQYNFYQVTAIDIIVDNYNFIANTTYQLEMDFTNQKLINANKYSVYGLNGESCSITYNTEYTRFDGQYPRWAFSCPHSTSTITIEISNSNGGYLWPQQQTNIFTWVYSYLKYTDVSVSGGDNSDIINNQNQNTQDIINNQNQNTQDIIDNQNQNTQDIINSNRVCETIDKNSIAEDNKVIYDTGVNNNNNFGITKYFKIDSDSEIKVLQSRTGYAMYCFYDINKTQLSCGYNNTLVSGNTLTIPNNASYFRASINKSENKPTFELCKNGNQALNDSIGGLTDSLTDDSPINIDSLGNTAGWLPAGPIDSIINLPLNLFNNLLTALNGTCQPLSIPLPYVNKTLPIPCISTIFNQIDGLPNFWTWVGIITSIVILYRYLINLYKYYDDLTTMKANFISDFGGAP